MATRINAISPGVFSSLRDLSFFVASVPGTGGLFVTFAEKGPDRELTRISSFRDLKTQFGRSLIKHGQGMLNAEAFALQSSNVYILRATTDDAAYSNQIAKIEDVNKTKEYLAEALDDTILTPTDGDVYLIKGTGINAFEGHDSDLATYFQSTWTFKEVPIGCWLKNTTTNIFTLRSELGFKDGTDQIKAVTNIPVTDSPDIPAIPASNDISGVTVTAVTPGISGNLLNVELADLDVPSTPLSVVVNTGTDIVITLERDAGVNSSATDQSLIYTSNIPGPVGDGITVTLTDPSAPNSPLNIIVGVGTITVSLETDIGSALISTTNDIMNAINLSTAVVGGSAFLSSVTGGAASVATTGLATTSGGVDDLIISTKDDIINLLNTDVATSPLVSALLGSGLGADVLASAAAVLLINGADLIETIEDGDIYIVQGTGLATGDWAGQDGNLAVWNESSSIWSFIAPDFWDYGIVESTATLWQYAGSKGWINRGVNPGLTHQIVLSQHTSTINTETELELAAAQTDVLYALRGKGRGKFYDRIFVQYSPLLTPAPKEKAIKFVMSTYEFNPELDDINEIETFSMSLNIDATDVSGESISIDHTINNFSQDMQVVTNDSTLTGSKLADLVNLTDELIEFGNFNASITDSFVSNTLATDFPKIFSLAGGDDGATTFNSSGAIDYTSSKVKQALLNSINGVFDAEITNTDGPDFSLVYDANYPVEVKAALHNLCIQRDDCMAILDMGFQSSVANAISARRSTYNFNDFHTAIYDNSTTVFNNDDGKDVKVTMPYHMATIMPRNDSVAEPWFAPAGLNRGTVTGVKKLSYNPNTTQRDDLYLRQVNVLSRVNSQLAVLSQLTSQQRASALQDINIVRMYLFAKKTISQFTKFFLFEQNDAITHNQVQTAISDFLSTIQGKRGLDSFTVEVSATEFQRKRKEFSVEILLVPTRTVEKIFLNFSIS